MMLAWRRLFGLDRSDARGRARPATRAERGQALVIVALAMIGLLAFVGLTVDAGILFIAEGHLRRAVDAAALAAATQFRVGRSPDQLERSADEAVHLNGVDPATLTLGICLAGDSHNDDSLCPAPGAPHRKLVRVTATSDVRFAFLGVIGIPGTRITANATSEAASVDVVLVIDTSNSMTYGVAGEIQGGYTSQGFQGNPMWDPAVCNAATPTDAQDVASGYHGYCLPFHYVKKAAIDFINHLFFPYDRLSIVTFDNVETVQVPLTNTLTADQITRWVKGNPVVGIGDGTHGLEVSPPRDRWYPGSPCTFEPYNPPVPPDYPAPYQPDPSSCQNTSIGGGLKAAGSEFGRQPRQEAVWVVILLTDGAPNASEPSAITGQINKFCPQSTWWDQTNDPRRFDPLCRDSDKNSRHTLLDPATYAGIDPGHSVPYNPNNQYDPTAAYYDAEDYARDNADFVSCPSSLAQAPPWCRDSLDYIHHQGGQGALLFAIGLGPFVIDSPQGGHVADASKPYGEARIDPSDPQAGYNEGDALLRYVSNVGMDGNPDPNDPKSPDPCQGVAPPALIAQPDPNFPQIPPGNLSYSCGNYYFAQFGTGLNTVFQSIASRVFTRITQ
jgi:hypothetical protein